MTNEQFNAAEIKWAHAILAKPAYTMPNGKQSHEVAYTVLNAAIDRFPTLKNQINAYGSWSYRAPYNREFLGATPPKAGQDY